MVCGLCAFSCHLCFHGQVDGTVHVSVPVSIVSRHLKLCKVCIEPERNARKLGGISLREIPWIQVIEIPWMEGVHGKSKSASDEAQGE
jgi:hypothetical protein